MPLDAPARRVLGSGSGASSGSSSSINGENEQRQQQEQQQEQQQQQQQPLAGSPDDALSAAATIDAIQRLTGRVGGSDGAAGPSAAAVAEAPGPRSPLDAAADRARAAAAALLAVFARAWAALTALLSYVPAWVAAQRLRQLREAADEAPGDADRQSALLAALNEQRQPRAVLERVEAKRYASNSAVVVEYIKALVATERIHEYGSTDAEAAAAAAAAAPGAAAGGGVADAAAAAAALSGVALAPGQDHRSLRQLLRELEAAALGSGGPGPGAGAGGSGVQALADETSPGGSLRRPLHVVVQGSFGGGYGSAPLARGRPGPLALLLRLATTAAAIVGLSFAWLVGAQAARRAAASGGLGAGMPGVSGAAAVSSSGGAGGLAGGGTPALDPKEYKKEELSETSVKSFKDVLGCDESKAELQEVVEFLKNPDKFTRLGAKLPKGVLLTGPPGTGKTLLARAVAGEAGVPFFYRAGSEFEELYVGVGSRRMRALFAAAKKKAPCIVFIDEIDAIGGNRKHWENHTRKTLNQLLVEMDGFEANEGVIVMAATNLPETLDPALKRPGRFDRQVAVPLPDVRGRAEVLRYYMQGKPFAADVDADLIARQTSGFSGADLSNLINEAALLAAQRDAAAVTASMIDYAYDKILMGVERKTAVRSQEALRRTAYHESGHALVALSTPGASPIHKATIVPRGHALGMVTQVGREDEFSINRQQMMARILVCMGGQVAEEIVFGKDQVSSGATDDLRQATEWARHMVAECGMSEAVGPVYIKDPSSAGPSAASMLSEATKQQVDAEVRSMLVEARARVTRLLNERLADLHTLSRALLEHETLTAADIKRVLAGERLAPPAKAAAGAAARGAPAPAVEAAAAAALDEQ
ncbi:ATP-dependent zinc metalloprotease [Raphidocelis subcapitata]|uniref:ATP-dependent zinc metalloprotease n=1 Tax=Raphidocelis subcapitata TaxID=307507 RepID=A0A2V0PJZ9_9CHLO|nr:ATP-dependent zinc metalloprotease [Raphidocelis subcapitata]|eukprot:GBF97365.1 ATP-dependent zinc metalloprotease [Raphidocelis subcapitata]